MKCLLKMAKKITQEYASSVLSEVPLEKEFKVYNGPSVNNLVEFYEVLLDMTDEQFDHHRHSGRNDFYNWIKFVVRDTRLANDTLRVKSRTTMAKRNIMNPTVTLLSDTCIAG